VLPLPQDETLWESLHLIFATASGNVRRNRLSDFRNVRAAGLIAMKLDDGDRLIGVATCREGDDVLLATRAGRCIRFQLTDDVVRVFAGRDSSGVRGIKLQGRDEVINLSVLRHIDASPAEREAYIKLANARRRGTAEDEPEPVQAADTEEIEGEVNLTAERIAEMEAAEEMLLTVTDMGFGKRSSAYEYRVTGRGGQGIVNITLAPRNGKSVVATFPVREGDDVMLVTDIGRLIRVPADQVRITGRQAMGVTLFRVDAGEHVTSVFPVIEEESDDTESPGEPLNPGDGPMSDPSSDEAGTEDGNDEG
jgi:DNA gyrase subunit A